MRAPDSGMPDPCSSRGTRHRIARPFTSQHRRQLVGSHECGDDREHGLGLVALERLDHQREPRLVGEEPDGDLRLQPPLFRKARLAEPVPGIGLEVQGADDGQHQAGRAQAGMGGAGRGDLPPPRVLGIGCQAPLHGPVGRGRDSGLFQHPQRIQLADRLDDPGQHQVPEDFIAAGSPVQAQDLPGVLQRIEQAVHP
jgi:hypothetical protein